MSSDFDQRLANYMARPDLQASTGAAPVVAPKVDEAKKPTPDAEDTSKAQPDAGGAPDADDGVKLSDAEVKARALGWNPDKEAVEKSGKRFTSAEEYLRIRDLTDEVSKRNKETKQLRKELERVKKQQEAIVQAEVDRRIADLKAQRKEAIAAQDHDAIDALDEKIEQAKNAPAMPDDDGDDDDQADDKPNAAGETAADMHAVAEKWMHENPWYSKSSKHLQSVAYQHELDYRASHPNCTTAQALRFVTNVMLTDYPELGVYKSKLATGGSARSSAPATASAYTAEKLSPADRNLYNALKRGSHFKDSKAETAWLKSTIEG